MKLLKKFCFSAVLSAVIVVILDCCVVYFNLRMTPVEFAFVWLLTTVVLAVFGKLTFRRFGIAMAAAAACIAVACALAFGTWNTFQKTAAYRKADLHKQQLFQDRNVMVIVPHQDDDVNLMCGVTEEFINYGSDVRIVFMTNGDYNRIPEIRIEEAIAYASLLGIPEENVIFLGYGDRWDPEYGIHVYNAPEGMVVPSYYGAEQTYGTDSHPAYRQGNPYTAANYLADMESVILEYRPDVIFCTDYDNHIDHKATSLNFEKAMGRILQQVPDYHPIVYKGYAYNTSWYAAPDFYRTNILSTNNVFIKPNISEPRVYRWDMAVRFPVDAAALSRSLVCSGAYKTLKVYASQNARNFAPRVVNGDRVFWQRRTDSLCARAEVTASTGNGALLNNFMYLDNFDLWEQQHPYDGVWTPDAKDPGKTVEFAFSDAHDVYSIVLYDHPSETDNVLNAEIVFDDGTRIETGALDACGAATEFVVEKQAVKGFSVTLLETEGEEPGLTEIEALPAKGQGDMVFAKLMDEDGQFVYDYWLTEGDSLVLTLYTHGMEPAVLQAVSDNSRMKVSVSGREVHVTCPEGEEGQITVSDENGKALDIVYVSNPGQSKRLLNRMGQRIEEYAAFQFRNSMFFRLGERAVGILQRIF